MARRTSNYVFLFSDMVGSTELWCREPVAMLGTIRRHNEMFRAQVESHAGAVVKYTGDGIHAIFDSVAHAVEAAGGAQLAVSSGSWPVAVEIRTAVHCGPAEMHDGDFYGRDVNLAARLADTARPGEVLVSDVAADALAVAGEPRVVAVRGMGDVSCRSIPATVAVRATARRTLELVPETRRIAAAS